MQFKNRRLKITVQIELGSEVYSTSTDLGPNELKKNGVDVYASEMAGVLLRAAADDDNAKQVTQSLMGKLKQGKK